MPPGPPPRRSWAATPKVRTRKDSASTGELPQHTLARLEANAPVLSKTGTSLHRPNAASWRRGRTSSPHLQPVTRYTPAHQRRTNQLPMRRRIRDAHPETLRIGSRDAVRDVAVVRGSGGRVAMSDSRVRYHAVFGRRRHPGSAVTSRRRSSRSRASRLRRRRRSVIRRDSAQADR